MIRVTTGISFPEPESVLNSMLVDDLFGVDGQGGENHIEFSVVIVCGNRTVTQTF